ncbi:hypothetical protein LRS74_23835 [Streptomyces sp. LX-29]|uniref:hypothetical protein n=1 Tax=Streptomyces sp. LX-29 TaxID=2900152 RepID=UPI00240E2CCB|nr:hypothetical protein [Streptomyces sp. LX-29]WFB11987.1 hypothetical protein LRS74_23835 [Streptomyces sp. LX-29]
MPRLLAAAATAVVAAALAVAAAFGLVAVLDATPEQPNVPLVTFPTAAPDPDADERAGAGEGGDRTPPDGGSRGERGADPGTGER